MKEISTVVNLRNPRIRDNGSGDMLVNLHDMAIARGKLRVIEDEQYRQAAALHLKAGASAVSHLFGESAHSCASKVEFFPLKDVLTSILCSVYVTKRVFSASSAVIKWLRSFCV